MATIDKDLRLRTSKEEEKPFLRLIPEGWKPAWDQWQNREQTHRFLRSKNYGCAGCRRNRPPIMPCNLYDGVCQAMGENYPFWPADWLIISWDFDADYPDWYTQDWGSPQNWILCSLRVPKPIGPQAMDE